MIILKITVYAVAGEDPFYDLEIGKDTLFHYRKRTTTPWHEGFSQGKLDLKKMNKATDIATVLEIH